MMGGDGGYRDVFFFKEYYEMCMVGVFDIVCEWKELVIDELVMNEHTLHLNIHWLLCHNI